MYQDSSFGEPCNEGDERDQQRRAGCERAKARRIAAGNLAKREADNQRNCRSNRGCSVARPAKDPENQSSEETSVKTCLRRQVRERRIPQRRREQICGERNASENVTALLSPIIGAQPGESRNPTGKRRRTHRGTFIPDTVER